jgi:hypothetical protein
MKKIVLVLFLVGCSVTLFAQQDDDSEEKTGGFKKEKLFTGGDFALSFYSGGLAVGISPYIGYSLTSWMDAAVSLNFLYLSQNQGYGSTYKQTNFGPGAFIRVFPLNFLYFQAQYEHNFVNYKYTYQGGITSETYKTDVNSLLLGIGYSGGRSLSNKSYFYLSLMFDVLQLPGSPYVDYYGQAIPIIKAGYNISLFQGRN